MNGIHFCNAPTCTFHQNLFLLELVTMAQRSRSSKSARVSAPENKPHVSDFVLTKHAPTCTFHHNLFWVELVIMAQRSIPQSVLDYPPQKKGPKFQIFLNQAYLECPNLYLSPQPVFGRIGHNGSQFHLVQVCSIIPPPEKRAPCFNFF